MEKKITYLNEHHRKNSEAAMKYIAESKNLKIDWEKESERQKLNSKDATPSKQHNKEHGKSS